MEETIEELRKQIGTLQTQNRRLREELDRADGVLEIYGFSEDPNMCPFCYGQIVSQGHHEADC